MLRRLKLIAITCLLVVSLPALAQDKALPRVLVIADAATASSVNAAGGSLKGKVQVVVARMPEHAIVNSSMVLEYLDQVLGYADANGKPVAEAKRPKWDLIHINVGLGDLIHRVPDMKNFRVLPIHTGGVVATSPEQYSKNLDELIKRLKATGSKVVWASTTPIRHSTSNVFELGTEIEYNAIAAKVMARHKVPTNDMYTYVKNLINMDKPAGHGADPFYFDRKPIHMPIVRVIEQAFGLPPLPETKEEAEVKAAQQEPAPAQG